MTPTLDPEFDYHPGPAASFASHTRTAFRPFGAVTPKKQRLINQVVTYTQILADNPMDAYWQARLGEAQAELDEYLDAESAISAALGIVEYERETPPDLGLALRLAEVADAANDLAAQGYETGNDTRRNLGI